ncbi:8217_t:CDS:2 [Diversispora eburnea]|uniref:8217_t:CDS:1 n=1 Tax=Diversispora eburnea TaxID=1213867 RepID=A0A9N9AI96_9GLOM|nr:8217_t:CDS:2 [Diversispora eburnea]
MPNESTINHLSPIEDTFQSQLSFDSRISSLIYEQDIDTQTTSYIIQEQEIQIKSSTPSNAHVKSKVWDYFTKPYGPSKSRKTKCSICKIEFSYHGAPFSLKYHLKNKHNIDLSTNLSQVKRQSQKIPNAFQSQSSFDSGISLHHEQDIITETTSALIYEQDSDTIIDGQEIQIESVEKQNAPFVKLNFHIHGSTSSFKYHLKNKHKIDMSTNLSQVKKQLQQIPSRQSNFSPSEASENENNLLQYKVIPEFLSLFIIMNYDASRLDVESIDELLGKGFAKFADLINIKNQPETKNHPKYPHLNWKGE